MGVPTAPDNNVLPLTPTDDTSSFQQRNGLVADIFGVDCVAPDSALFAELTFPLRLNHDNVVMSDK